MQVDKKIIETVLESVPQQTPFRFIDDIIEIGSDKIVSTYTFKDDEYFYSGHFQGHPITPGVILIETMAQSGVVALGIYQLMKQGLGTDQLRKIIPLFAFVDQVEFSGIVKPGDGVIVKGEKIYFRKGTIKSKVKIENETGHLICHGLLTGAGVNINGKK